MNRLKTNVLFVYLSHHKPDFWIFDGKVYHQFIRLGQKFRYVRAARGLPGGAYGCAIDLERSACRLLAQTARKHHVQLYWYPDSMEAEQAEMSKNHPTYVFGLTEPAGVFHFPNTGTFFDH